MKEKTRKCCRILQENTRLKALDEIYKIYTYAIYTYASFGEKNRN